MLSHLYAICCDNNYMSDVDINRFVYGEAVQMVKFGIRVSDKDVFNRTHFAKGHLVWYNARVSNHNTRQLSMLIDHVVSILNLFRINNVGIWCMQIPFMFILCRVTTCCLTSLCTDPVLSRFACFTAHTPVASRRVESPIIIISHFSLTQNIISMG